MPALQKIEDATTTIRHSTNSLAGAVAEIRQESEGTAQRIVEAVTAHIPAKATPPSNSTPDKTMHPSMYVMPTNWGYDARVCGREGVNLRQVLIDTESPGEKILKDMDNTGLAWKAKEVVSAMGADDTHRLISARRLSNSRIVFEFTSEEAAKWVNEAQHRIQFTQAIASDTRIKTQLFPLALQFISLHFRPERRNELWAIKGYNKLPCGAINIAQTDVLTSSKPNMWPCFIHLNQPIDGE
jgi:hypothetical protein